jgi:hypothetical protein
MNRDKWIVTNISNATISLGIVDLPAMRAGDHFDLLHYASKTEIANSSDIRALLVAGKVLIDKYEDGVLSEVVNAANADKALSLTELSDVQGATGTFTSQDGKTVTVVDGLITSIV